jgi:hypothetical protein
MKLALSLVLAVAVPLGACGESPNGAAVDFRAANAGELPCTDTVDSSRALRIGSDGESASSVWFGSTAGLTLTENRSIVVADAQRFRLYALDQQGEPLWEFGRAGAGPGEFRSLAWIASWADTVVAWDWLQNRFTYVDATGRHLGDRPSAEGRPIGRLDDGSLSYRINTVRTAASVGAFTDSFRIQRVSADETVLSSTGPHAGFERYADLRSGFSVWLVPFGRRPSYHARAGATLIAEATDATVEVIRDGVSSVIRVPETSRAVTDADIARYRSEALSGSRTPALTESMLRDVGIAKRTPAYGNAFLDRLGRIWVARYPLPDDSLGQYSILSQTGQSLGTVRVPATWDVLDADDLTVVGTSAGDDDTPQVVIAPAWCEAGSKP